MIILTLWRFGGYFEVVADKEETGVKLLKKEYTDFYKRVNGCRPTPEEWKKAAEDIEREEIKINKVIFR